jgi:hypothetical protein
MSKTCPSCGYHEPDMQAQYCNKCGYPFPQHQPPRPPAAAPAGRPAPHTAKQPVHRKAGGGGFLSFGTLLTENNLKMIYILGTVMIVLVSLMGIAGMFAKKTAGGVNASLTDMAAIAEYPAGSPLFWIGFLVAANLLWRMFCELFALLSRAHGAPDYAGEEAPEDEPAEYEEPVVPARRPAGQGQMVECPKCHRIVPFGDLRECEDCGVQGCVNCIRLMGLLKKKLTCRECYEGK